MPEPLDRAALRAWLLAEHARPFTGWDFSFLAGRRESLRPADTWDFTAAVVAAARAARSLLDIGTGGGERLATLPDHPPLTCATEGYPPNVPIAGRRLGPLGIRVVAAPAEGPLPFVDGAFGLVTNRHAGYDPAEVRRVLAPGGHFITQQVGWQTNRRLHELLGDPTPPVHELLGDPTPPGWNPASRRGVGWELTTAVPPLTAAGFDILEAREEFPIVRYRDVGAIVAYLKAVPWEIPDFTVDGYFDRLVALDALIRAEGQVDIPFHTFFIRAQRP